MSVSYGDVDLFTLLARWYRARRFWRQARRAIELECDRRADNIIRHEQNTYLYTITCCGVEIDIWIGVVSHCPGCGSTFSVSGRLPAPARESDHTMIIADLSEEDVLKMRRLRHHR